jgi:hypothetical protein
MPQKKSFVGFLGLWIDERWEFSYLFLEYILQQFDAYGNLLHKLSTKLAVSSYGEDELISLIQT